MKAECWCSFSLVKADGWSKVISIFVWFGSDNRDAHTDRQLDWSYINVQLKHRVIMLQLEVQSNLPPLIQFTVQWQRGMGHARELWDSGASWRCERWVKGGGGNAPRRGSEPLVVHLWWRIGWQVMLDRNLPRLPCFANAVYHKSREQVDGNQERWRRGLSEVLRLLGVEIKKLEDSKRLKVNSPQKAEIECWASHWDQDGQDEHVRGFGGKAKRDQAEVVTEEVW